MKKEKIQFFWHIHHDILLEPLTEPIKNRIKYIKENKLKNEIELRLKLLKPVKGKLPKEFIEAEQKYDEAVQKYDEARQKCDEAIQKCDETRGKCDEMWNKYKPQIESLHKKECPDCPWTGTYII